MASPFELLEAYVAIVDRGLDQVFARIDRLQSAVNKATKPATLRFTETGIRPVNARLKTLLDRLNKTYTIKVKLNASALDGSSKITRLTSKLEKGQTLRVKSTGLPAIQKQVDSIVRKLNKRYTLKVSDSGIEPIIGKVARLETSIRKTHEFNVESPDLDLLRFDVETVRNRIQQPVTMPLRTVNLSPMVRNATLFNRQMRNVSSVMLLISPRAAGITSNLASASTGAVGLATSMGLVRIAAAGTLASLLLIPAVLTAIGTAAAIKFERPILGLEVLTGSAERGNAVFAQLQNQAIRYGGNLKTLIDGAVRLINLGSQPTGVADELRRLNSIATVTGGNLNQLIKAYTDIRSFGALRAQEFNQLANANFPLKDLADTLGVMVSELKGGIVTSTEFEAALKRLTDQGSKFAEVQLRGAETTTALLERAFTLAEKIALKLSQQEAVGTFLDGTIVTLRDADKLTDRLVAGWDALAFAAQGISFDEQIGAKVAEAARQIGAFRDDLEKPIQVPQGVTEFVDSLTEQLTTPFEIFQQEKALLEQALKLDVRVDDAVFARGMDLITAKLKEAREATDEYAKAEAARKSAQQVTDTFALPIEAFQKRADELRQFLNIPNGISYATYERAIEGARKKLIQATRQAQELQKASSGQASSLIVGTVQEYNVRIADDRQGEETRLQQALVTVNEQANQHLAEANAALEELVDATDRPQKVVIDLPAADISGI